MQRTEGELEPAFATLVQHTEQRVGDVFYAFGGAVYRFNSLRNRCSCTRTSRLRLDASERYGRGRRGPGDFTAYRYLARIATRD